MKAKKANQLRGITIERQFTRYAAGSVLIKQGETWVLCTACIDESVPPFLREEFKGIIVIGAVLLQKKEKAS